MIPVERLCNLEVAPFGPLCQRHLGHTLSPFGPFGTHPFILVIYTFQDSYSSVCPIEFPISSIQSIEPAIIRDRSRQEPGRTRVERTGLEV